MKVVEDIGNNNNRLIGTFKELYQSLIFKSNIYNMLEVIILIPYELGGDHLASIFKCEYR